jgi:asparagine synthase (glutamine-hydrolysing)
MGALRLEDWERIELDPEELDWLGPFATAALRQDGLLYPANTLFYGPLLQRAHGGSLLTGYGGDELLQDWRWAPAGGAGSRIGRVANRALMLAYAAAPRALRAWGHHDAVGRALVPRYANLRPTWPWLRAPVAREAHAAIQREKAAEPPAWNARTAWQARRRFLTATCWSMSLRAERAGVTIVNPFLAPRFVAALAAAGGTFGLGTRTDVMRHIFSGCLPDDVLSRGSKAGFGRVFWGVRSRAFAESWDGSGVPLDLVKPEALRSSWLESRPPFSSALLLQAAWLSGSASALT